ncbi:isopentenyl-diphosphate Delta-isomerase [Micromonospora saelicesensis]|uniref:Isopentenyl-diphosphate Delta-isomerase n=2 Tax=Micromonospora saelicesensis TaxID=285676 RepID=A0A1C4UZ64_9ACTN|nr:isopentenyl-diphosphate Delta-isomerase [Micromonospora saelicesensis]RAO06324.1 Isopentenyl-diphosphate Delta-isomerase [Micromonospora saelicesensis]RAO61843.1 Isopentenyl-diphosphate Delta-isomerase [Micromonospora saelicesensis]SCE77038.1 isopentenyl-diphosphate delta-isomerase [Micromonospora saelicesensis]
MSSREKHLVELVDETGKAHGETTVAAAHQPPGQLHRAFSVLLVDPDGQVLLQRRAAVKTRFPLRWANSCCGHPQPGESLAEAANRRLSEELGAGPVELTEVGVYVYYAEDPATGRVEFEYDHVLRGEFLPGAPLLPDQDEVAEVRWADPTALEAELKLDPRSYAPWLGGVVNRLLRPAESTSGATGPAMTPPGSSADDTAERSGGR